MTEQEFIQLIAEEMNFRIIQVKNTIELLDEGNTVPFISRYRKEMTGSLDEEEIRAIQDRITYLRMLDERKQTVLKSIEEQGKLTPELEKKIKDAVKLQTVEDLYLPYKPKKRTKATVAKEKGLEPLAEILLAQTETKPMDEIAAQFIDEEKEVLTVEEALQGARDIVAETVSDDADIRQIVRELTRNHGVLKSSAKKEGEESDYELYYEFAEPVNKVAPHKTLAINRGERERFLKAAIAVDKEVHLQKINERYIKNKKFTGIDHLLNAFEDGYKRLIFPSIEREIRSELTKEADTHAIEVFGKNLRNLLLQPPIAGKVIIGIDPGYRSGCKVAVIDKTGKYLEGATIYPHPPQNKMLQAKEIVRDLANKYDADVIA
ncbi:MAG: RNA-binding transcriptional accessory protein, partial [Calditrichia bacterium]|nr:RNA-binding transcriptional accessory protein [Calditrichia bacterium]